MAHAVTPAVGGVLVRAVMCKDAASADIEAKARLHYPAEGSHGWNHIQDVLANARRMRRRELRRNELAAIMYHDSSLMTGDRETHADDSAAIARKELAGLFRKRQLADIVNAIAHHRASYEGARSSRLEDLVAAADRPVPDLAKQVARSWRYHEELGEPEGLRAENVASHLREKYGHGGYAYGNAPRLYLKTYGRELRDIMSKFDGLTPESVAAIVSGAEKKAADRKFLSAFGDLAEMPQTASNPTDADMRAAFRVDPAKVRGHDTVPHFMASVENVNPQMGRALWGMAKGRRIPRVSVFSGSTPRSLASTANAAVAARQSWPNGMNTAYAALTNMYDRAGRKTGRPVWDVQKARPTPYGMRRDGIGVQVR